MYKLYLTCNWDNNENISNHWESKLDKNIPIKITTNRNEADYYIVFNKPHHSETDFEYKNKKTILIRMEPFMKQNVNIWGEWANPDYSIFFSVISPPETLNFIEWHLNKTFDELTNDRSANLKRYDNVVSVILSDRYQDEGQIKRIAFIKYLQEQHKDDIELHIYGRGDLSRFGIKNQIRELPPYCKDDGIIPYRYHFNCENSFFMNYITEKLYDSILGGAFTFYAGGTNACSVYPKGGFELLNLDNFEIAANTMITMIKNNIYEKEYNNIKELGNLILENYTFSNRLYNIINKSGDTKLSPLYEDIEDVLKYRIPPTPPPEEVIPQGQLNKLLEDHTINKPTEDLNQSDTNESQINSNIDDYLQVRATRVGKNMFKVFFFNSLTNQQEHIPDEIKLIDANGDTLPRFGDEFVIMTGIENVYDMYRGTVKVVTIAIQHQLLLKFD